MSKSVEHSYEFCCEHINPNIGACRECVIKALLQAKQEGRDEALKECLQIATTCLSAHEGRAGGLNCGGCDIADLIQVNIGKGNENAKRGVP